MSNVLTHPWKKKVQVQHRDWDSIRFIKASRNYSSFTAFKLSNYSQLFPICLRLLMKGYGSSPCSRGGHPKPQEALHRGGSVDLEGGTSAQRLFCLCPLTSRWDGKQARETLISFLPVRDAELRGYLCRERPDFLTSSGNQGIADHLGYTWEPWKEHPCWGGGN